MDQVLQIVASLLIVVAFIAVQRGAMLPASRNYLVLNLVGSTVLALIAFHVRQYGFLILETVWALASGWGLFLPASAVHRTTRRDKRR